ncbi:MAG: hypothetical protein ISS19_18755 [Bacteroidales bacterium]|nr:hypothetical protein [Bacteroidales bacterium]
MKLIEGFKVEDDILLFDYLPNIPVHSPFGHLGEKYLFLIYRLFYTNDTIREIYFFQREYYGCRQNKEFDNNIKLKILHRVLRFSTEIKVILDEFISIYFILNYNKEKNSWPKKISIDSIGKYLSKSNNVRYEIFEKHRNLIETTNSIGNAIKHSFVNSEITWIRNDTVTPYLIAYYHKDNDLKNKVEFHSIKLPDYLDELNKFLPEYNFDVKNNYS